MSAKQFTIHGHLIVFQKLPPPFQVSGENYRNCIDEVLRDFISRRETLFVTDVRMKDEVFGLLPRQVFEMELEFCLRDHPASHANRNELHRNFGDKPAKFSDVFVRIRNARMNFRKHSNRNLVRQSVDDYVWFTHGNPPQCCATKRILP
jgi:hypothetical protein